MISVRGPGAAGTTSLNPWWFPERCLNADQLAAYPNVSSASVIPAGNCLRGHSYGFSIPGDHSVVSMSLKDLRVRSAAHHPTPPTIGGHKPSEVVDLTVRWSPDGNTLLGNPLVIALDQFADGLQGSFAFSGAMPTVAQLLNSNFSLLFGIGTATASFGIDHFLLEVVTSPPIPSSPSLSGYADDASCSLVWNAPANSVSFVLKRGASVGGPFSTVVYSGPSVRFTEAGLTNGVEVHYVVQAVGESGTSINSNVISLTPTATPSPPTAPIASAVGVDEGVRVSWTFVVGAIRYEVRRLNPATGTYESALETTELDWVDTSVVPGETQCYKVVAFAAKSSSGPSNAACALRSRYRKGHVRLKAARSFQDLEAGGYDERTGCWIPGHLRSLIE